MSNKEVIRLQLEEILVSRLFSGKKQASNFLAYIVNETLAGRGDRITQYAIAVEALGKPPDYCPTENPAVRVEAGRVRKLLRSYYEDEGWGSGLQFVLPTGSYRPEFKSIGLSDNSRTKNLYQDRACSVGPKVYVVCENPLQILDPSLRNVAFHLNSSLPMVLGKHCAVQIALGDVEGNISLNKFAEQIWKKYQAEFFLKCTLDNREAGGFSITVRLVHVLSCFEVWTRTFHAELADVEAALEASYRSLVREGFSLFSGHIFRFWSRYWSNQTKIPDHYKVLVAHANFVQNGISEDNFFEFFRSCQYRIRHYPDDSTAYLNYSILCLYAYMFRFDLGEESFKKHWSKMALKALELNPGSALAHAAFALSCHLRGDNELGEVEVDFACRSNPYDNWAALLISVGLCAMGRWQKGFVLLKDYLGGSASAPDPFRTVPCISYFRGGSFYQSSRRIEDKVVWTEFGKLVAHCQMGDCRGCVERISYLVDESTPEVSEHYAEYEVREFWKSIQSEFQEV